MSVAPSNVPDNQLLGLRENILSYAINLWWVEADVRKSQANFQGPVVQS